MSEFHTVARVGEIPAGEGRSFQVEGRMVGVYFVDGEYTAIDDICSHMGATLSDGNVEDGVVYCPWHAWRFCIKEGTWLDNPKSAIGQQCFEVRIQDDEIQVRVPVD